MRDVTLIFPVERNSDGQIEKILLAMKKRGFGAGRWNGTGGKVDEGETILDAATREADEELSIQIAAEHLSKVAELDFIFPHEPDWDQKVHVFFVETWEGTPTESEEMAPEWFSPEAIPYTDMWSADGQWIPRVINSELVRGAITFGEGDKTLKCELKTVEGFD